MKKIAHSFFLMIMMAGFITASGQSESEMKAWMEYMTPGDIHKMMASWDGEWEGDIKMWMAPGQDPIQSKASSVNKMILGGRYQESRTSGNFNGMPLEGISTTAYDNSKKKFINTWIDNFGTGVMLMEGTWDPSTKTIEYSGKSLDPMVGKNVQMRQTIKIIDDNTQLMEMFTTPDGGKEFKTMEITMKRKN